MYLFCCVFILFVFFIFIFIFLFLFLLLLLLLSFLFITIICYLLFLLFLFSIFVEPKARLIFVLSPSWSPFSKPRVRPKSKPNFQAQLQTKSGPNSKLASSSATPNIAQLPPRRPSMHGLILRKACEPQELFLSPSHDRIRAWASFAPQLAWSRQCDCRLDKLQRSRRHLG